MKKNLKFVRCVFFLSLLATFPCLDVLANRLYEDIQFERSLGSPFRAIESPLKQISSDRTYALHFKTFQEVSFFNYDLHSTESLDRTISMIIPSTNGDFKLELVQVNDNFYDYSVATSDGKIQKSNTSYKHYRGIVNGDPNSIVAISFFENEIMGMISNSAGNYNLVYDPKSKKHIFFNDKNLDKKGNFSCGTPDNGDVFYDKSVLLEQKKLLALPTEGKCVRIYFETEEDIFTARGSVANVEAYVAGLFNQVSTLYFNEAITIALSQIFVWTTPDPYTSTTMGGLLGEFQSTRTSINGELGQLITFRNVGGGQAAGQEGLCNSSVSEKLAIASVDIFVFGVPTYSQSVEVVTHELGHLFGSRHTHACVWNGNNTAIDGCSATEGGCPNPGIPAAGTIMSYCHLQVGVGINFNLGFGPQPGNLIRNKVWTASCLCSCCPYITGPDLICTNGSFVANNIPSGATVTWGSGNTSMLTINSSTGVATAVSGARGFVFVSATYTGVNGSLVRVRRTVYVGAPTFIMTIDGNQTTSAVVSPGGLYGLNAATQSPGATSYTYTDFAGSGDMSISLSPSGSFSYAVVSGSSTSGHREIVVQGTNSCGSINQNVYLFMASMFKMYPNPAKSELTLEFSNALVKKDLPVEVTLMHESSTSPVKTVSVWDYFDKKLFKDGNKIILDVSQLQRGTYYLHVKYDQSQEQRSEKIRVILE